MNSRGLSFFTPQRRFEEGSAARRVWAKVARPLWRYRSLMLRFTSDRRLR